MRNRYDPLPGDRMIFRMARTGGGFLPPGHVLPKPEWLEPDERDVAEATSSGRPAGLSVWDMTHAKHADACWIRALPHEEQASFSASIDALRQVALRHSRRFDVVADSILSEVRRDPRLGSLSQAQRESIESTALGHSLAEGIRRPAGFQKGLHRSFMEELAGRFEPIRSES